jgi:DNA-directed RNA polymerase specialized sigma24 family protein
MTSSRVRSIDSAAARVLADLYPGLRRFAAICTPLHVDPDDVVQDAIAGMLAAGSIERLDDPGAYLRTSIRRLAQRHYGSAPSLDAEEVAVDAYPSDLSVLEGIPMADRIAVYLVDIEGLSTGEAAVVAGCSRAALRSRVIRARRQLRRLL